jgi:hypothetical protein
MLTVMFTAMPAPVSTGVTLAAFDRAAAAADDDVRDDGDAGDRVSTLVVDSSEEEEHVPTTPCAPVAAQLVIAHFESHGAPFASERSRLLKPPRA